MTINNKCNIAVLVFVFFVAACTNRKYPSNPIEYFDSIKSIEGEKVLVFDDYEIYKPVAILVEGNDIYVQNDGEYVLYKIHQVERQKTVLLKRGEGPGEVLSITYITESKGKIVTIDCNRHELIEIPIGKDSVNVVFSELPDGYGAYTSVVENSRGLILLGSFAAGRYMYYRQLDGEEKIDFWGDYRVQDKYDGLDHHVKSLIYISSKIAIKPDLTRFVAVNFNNGVIDINTVTNDSIINMRQMDFYYQDISVSYDEGKAYVSNKRNNKNGFFDVAISDRYIYTIYSGKSFDEAGLSIDDCDYILVFDWNGNPVTCYRTNISLCSICYDEKTDAVYGINIGEEAALYRFKI